MLVREHIPLKQGLRLFPSFPRIEDFLVREHIPLKQGLRQQVSHTYGYQFNLVREHIPLKQGLRRKGMMCVNVFHFLSESIFH